MTIDMQTVVACVSVLAFFCGVFRLIIRNDINKSVNDLFDKIDDRYMRTDAWKPRIESLEERHQHPNK